MEDEKVVKISVRNLVEFILVSGDINNKGLAIKDAEAMQEGIRIHKKIQKSMKDNYTSEVLLSTTITVDGVKMTIDGRADGIIQTTDKEIIIDEIKGIYMDLKDLPEPVAIHKAQVMCYAYMYALQQDIPIIGIQLTYCNIPTEDIKRFGEVFELDFLKNWFMGILKEFAKWMNFKYNWEEKRNASITNLEFPYNYRRGQKELVTGVYKTIIREKKLFIEAPTGVGKTLSTVYPAIKAMGLKYSDKIFYLTAKTIARTTAEDAFIILKEKGLLIKVITLTAKDKLCILDKADCNPITCERARGHYDRVNECVFTLLNKENTITRDIILEYAKQYSVCPFEMSLDISLWVDGIICDYNYVFDPNVQLKRFFKNGKKNDYIFLIDEAHNLVDRARQMYSAALYKSDFAELKKIIAKSSKKFAKKIGVCNKYLSERKKEGEGLLLIKDITQFVIMLSDMMEEFEKFLQEGIYFEEESKVLEFYFAISNFLNRYEKLDENYLIYTDHEDSNGFKIKILCVDPSKDIRECTDKVKSTIFFSATLLPIHYYKELLGGNEEDYAIYCDSPFNTQKRLLMIGRDISTKYTRRNLNEYKKIIEYILLFTNKKVGNYLIFFPSYSLMKSIIELGSKEFEYADLLIQHSNMTEKEREEYLEKFTDNPNKTIIGFAVMGGIFGEGIDLKEDRLIGCVIIGPGLPGVGGERELFRSYYEEKNNKGFEYAYLYPGMNKVLQSAGRVIRTESDRGMILLLDERFAQNQYQELFPREWYPYMKVTINTMSEEIKEFWNKKE